MPETALRRELSFPQATAINMIDMVGIGPFITLSLIAGALQGPHAILAWLIGALLAYTDGMVWSELGARYPEAGGSYIFLQKLYGEKTWGRFMAFLFTWQTSIQAPLVVASGAIGFSQYFSYLYPLDEMSRKIMSGALVILITIILYRRIGNIGKISVALWIITGGAILWVIVSGFTNFKMENVWPWDMSKLDFTPAFFVALGQASLKSVYSFLGYYNVCHLGGEIQAPEKNIPKSIFYSITGITFLYLGMQWMVTGVLGWQQVASSDFVISKYFETIYGQTAAQIATALVLVIALSSLFSVLLGYSRVPYAAAKDGNFFSIFSKVHPKHHFPHISLLALAGVAFIFSLLFKMKEVITAIITMRILIQFVSQACGVIYWHYKKPNDRRPYTMPLFPIPAILSILVWLFIFLSNPFEFIAGALIVIAAGCIIFFGRALLQKTWPFVPKDL